MKPASLLLSALAFLIAASIALAIILGFGVGDTMIAFVVGAIVGSQTGAILHARQPSTVADARPKLLLGTVLAVVAVAFGVVIHLTLRAMTYPEVTIPISAIGSFIFPFAVFNTMFNSVRNSRKRES